MRISNISSRVILSGALFAALATFGCVSGGSSPVDAVPDEFSGAPNWVLQGCNSYLGEPDKSKLCGVGWFHGSRNFSLARSAAMARGRTEIAYSLGVKVRDMLKDYQATTTGGVELADMASDEQHVVDVSRQITNTSLTGTELRGTWMSNSGTYYALMVLDVEQFEKSVKSMKRLPDTLRDAITQRAEAAFSQQDSRF